MLPSPGSQASAVSLAASPTATSSRAEDRGDHQLLFGEGTEDLFFHHLDDSDFSALAAACCPTPTTTQPHSNPPSWASTAGFPCESTAMALPFMAPADSIAASEFDSDRPPPPPGSFSPPCPSISPSRQSSVQRSFPSGDAGSGGRLVTAARLPSAPGQQAAAAADPHRRAEGGRRARASAINSEVHRIPEAPSHPTVCLLAVGAAQDRGSANAASMYGGAHGLAGVVAMLTKELDRHGRTPEIDHVVSGERAVQRVKALARHGLWYRMVVLEVEGSLAKAAATARDLRWVFLLLYGVSYEYSTAVCIWFGIVS